MNEYENFKEGGAVGFAHGYLHQCCQKSKSEDEIDIQVYNKLVKLDSKIGTTAAEQLCCLVFHSLRLDLFKVSIKFKNIQ